MKSISRVNCCRVCGHVFSPGPLWKMSNMPKVAQYLPGVSSRRSNTGADLEVYQCGGCGLIQLNSAPVFYYREVIRSAAVSAEMKKFRVRQFGKFLRSYHLHHKKMIEIGCGDGEYLSIMQGLGFNAYGLEYNQKAVDKCREDGLKVVRGFVDESYHIPHAPFDAFFMFNFLEHLSNPNGMLRGVANNLIDGGVGIVEVPNFDMILRDRLFSEFMRDHLLYFTTDTLRLTLQLNGFEIISCSEVWHDYIISAVVKKRRGTNLSALHAHGNRIRKELDAYIDRFKIKSVAIWGAGHQAFAMLAMFNLGDKIKYIVDSAAFKQGKFSPVSYVPIVSPERLKSDPPEAVIAMAGSYSDEVARMARKKFRIANVSSLTHLGLKLYE